MPTIPQQNDSEAEGDWFLAKHERFVPLAFGLLKDAEYSITPFDHIINDALDRTMLKVGHPDRISRLIINIPPGFGKTLKSVWAYVSRGFAVNNRSNFIHASYSGQLVQDNSVAIRDIITHPEYREFYPHVKFKEDTRAKGLWRTSVGGQFLAAPAGGAITGFRAGILGALCFSGALIIDDPVKPDDARSELKIDAINSRWENVFKSRLADSNTPVIVIMQRISDNDFTSELLERTGANEQWHHLVLPAYIDPDYEYTQAGTYIEHNLPEGSLWTQKLSNEQARSSMGNIQWSQDPQPIAGEIFEREWFNRYTALPANIKSWSIYCDTASKQKKYNDFTVFQLWATTTDNHGYLVDQFRNKPKVPHLKDLIIKFVDDAKSIAVRWPKSKQAIVPSIEDKDSGTGAIQALQVEARPVIPIQRTEGKAARAVKASPHVLHGHIHLPVGPVGDSVIAECTRFKVDDSHKHDDQIDPLVDYINHELPNLSSAAVFGRTTGTYN